MERDLAISALPILLDQAVLNEQLSGAGEPEKAKIWEEMHRQFEIFNAIDIVCNPPQEHELVTPQKLLEAFILLKPGLSAPQKPEIEIPEDAPENVADGLKELLAKQNADYDLRLLEYNRVSVRYHHVVVSCKK